MIRSIKAITITLEREVYDFYRNFVHYALRSLLIPTLYIIVIGLGVGSMIYIEGIRYLEFLIPGVLMMTVVQVTHFHLSFEVLAAKTYEKYLELLTMVAPIHPHEAILGYILSGVLISVFTVLIFLIPLYFFFQTTFAPLHIILLFTAGLGAFFSATGFIAGIYFEDPHRLNIVNSLIITPLSFLCGVFFPLDLYPEQIRILIEFVPLTQAIEALRGNGSLLFQILYIWLSAIAAFAISIAIFKKKMIL
ncbi:MAG: ABC transporter permease [Archaeoglobaceae archaeon]|nr:ABC transporter permease [Archaeoglobaceae archaeon]